MTLLEAINAVENASTALSNADSAQSTANDKFAAAKAAKDAADKADYDARTSFNGSLDSLIAAATASKVELPPAA